MAGGQKTAAAFLIAELRHARMSKGLSQEDLGRAINYSGSLVSAVELGQQAPTAKYLELVDEALATSGLFGRMLAELVSLDRVQPWLRGARAIVSQARMLRWYEPLYVPGLLQTEGYARAVFEAGGLLDPSVVERRLVERMEQQGILLGGHPPQLVAVVDEAALRRRVGDAKVMADQAMHLARTASEHPRVRLHVVPRTAEEYPGLGGPFILATLRDGGELAFLTSHIGGQELDQPEDLSLLHQVWEASLGEAYTPRQSIEVLKEMAESWS